MADEREASIPTGRGAGFRAWGWFSILACFLSLLYLFWIRGDHARQTAAWRTRLEALAGDRHRLLNLWLSERTSDGQLWAKFPTVRALAIAHAGGAVSHGGEIGGHLAEVLSTAAGAYGYSSVRLLDIHGVPLSESAHSEPLTTACLHFAQETLAAHRQAVEVHLHSEGSRVAITTPVVDDGGRPVGIVLAELDPQSTLYPLLTQEPVPTRTGETLLLKHSRGETLLLTPRRHAGQGEVLRPLPPAAVRLASQLTQAHESFGRYEGEEGAQIFAATRAIESAGWLLVVRVSEDEALAPHRKLARASGIALIGGLGVLFLAFGQVRRNALVRTERHEREVLERQRLNEEHAARRLAQERAEELAVLETIATGAPLDTTFTAITRFVEDQVPEVLASILLVEERRLRHAVGPSLAASYLAAIDGIEVAEGKGSCGTAAFRGSRVVVTDVATDPLWKEFAALAEQHGLAACWSNPIHLADGSVAGTFALYRRSVGGPKPREIELVERATHLAAIAIDRHRVAAELAKSLAELGAIFDSSAVGMTLANLSGTLLKINPALREFLGFADEEMRGRHFGDFFHPDERQEGFPLFSQLLDGDFESYQTEKRFVRKDGQTVWGRVTVSLVEGSERSEPFVIGLVEDVTDRRRFQAEMQQTGKMEAIGRLAGGIAHDFNNILNVILGCGELALTELEGVPETRRLIEEILASADRAAVLTRQLLAFSRKQTFEMRVLDLGLVVEEMAQLLRRVLGEDVDVVLRRSPEALRVLADRGQVEQVLMNLVVNARDAMPTGGRLEIESSAAILDREFAAAHPGAQSGKHVKLSVTDNGCGMTKEVLTRVFEPFFTTKEPSKGTGLGLATVYGIVKQSNGYIGVTSAPGEGTRFDIYLPQVDEPVAAPKPAAVSTARGHETVLVVEDEPNLRKLLQTMLASLGYTVHVAPTAPAAVDMCVATEVALPIDLLLTDVVMPEMNGREVARRVRELRPSIKVLYMSGYTGDVLLQHGELEEGAGMIAKPFTRDALAAKIRETLA